MGIQTTTCDRNDTAVQTEDISQATALSGRCETVSVQTEFNRKDTGVQTSSRTVEESGTQTGSLRGPNIGTHTESPGGLKIDTQTESPRGLNVVTQTESPRGPQMDTSHRCDVSDTVVPTVVRSKSSVLSRLKQALGVRKRIQAKK